MPIRLALIIISTFSVTPAFAHWGHVGDLAGHSHWIGAGVIIAGGILAAVLGNKSAEEDSEAETEEAEGEAEGEAA